MTGHPIFISHASADDTFVAELRQRLEAHHLPVWVDSRNLRGGDKLAAELTEAIKWARQFIVVLSPQTVNSPWVRREIDQALKVERLRHADGYRVIPLLLSGITPQALGNWFKKEPVAVPIQLGPGGLAGAWPAILSALGERLPTDPQPAEQLDAKPLEELLLTLTDPKVEFQGGSRSITATATLVYKPANISARRVESRRFTLTVPLGPLEADDLRWYLERYFLWPVGVFKNRADGIERKLPLWGQSIFNAALGSDVTREALAAWQHASEGAERRFSVQVDKDLPDGASAEAQSAAGEAAAQWLALPWELLHDGRSWLFQGRYPVRVRRRLPNRREQPVRSTTLPIRILLVSPRPDQDEKGHPLGYIDHRISARPLVEAVETLGELVCLTLLAPPTYSALSRTLQEAADRGEPFDVVHFDGHGAYSRRLGMGGLCFEDPNDADKLIKRTMEFIDAHKLAGLFRQHRVPLVFLEACQSAQAEAEPAASVAASLLEEGVTSVVAMTHSVMVETSRRFVQAFYSALVRGARVGGAMLAGQRALFDDSQRGKVMGAGYLSLQDWFVPVIYQEEQDLRLINRIPAKELQQLEERKRRLSLGALPDEPTHKFQGRSRELLELERLLLGPYGHPWAVVRGAGGVGKTALAVELARWLTRTGRFERAAFVSLERHSEARAVLDTLGHQLLPQGDKYSVAQFRDLDQARQPVERALRDHATIVVVDNCESVLSALLVSAPVPAETLVAILALFNHLIAADPRTRLIFTTREPLPIPFDHPGRVRELGALNRLDAIELVSGVLKQHGWTPPLDDASGTPQEIANLVDAVHCHARALVLLAPEVARQGISATIAEVSAVIAELELKHPGDREKSLYASVALSLHRLPPASRVRIQALAVCQGGAHLVILTALTAVS